MTSRRKAVADNPDQTERNGVETVILTVGEVTRWLEEGEVLPQHAQLAFADIWDVTPQLLTSLSPALVLAPLLSRSFDCVDLAARLYDAHYQGRYRIMAPQLPKPDLVLAEIRSLFPGLDVDVGALADLAPVRLV